MKTALVTGGAGFIGSHIVEHLLKQNISVKVYDNLTSGSLGNLADLKSDIELIEADIRDIDKLYSAMKGIDYLFHQAALTSVSQSVSNPVLTYEINANGTLNVLSSALKCGVSRTVIASSCAVYGDIHHPPLREIDLPAPKSPYAASKLVCETLAESYYHSYGLESICLRYFNVYGSRQRPDSEYAAVIPRFIQSYQNRQPPQIYGSGTQSRDFINVVDVAKANILAAFLSSDVLIENRIFNIGNGIETTIMKLIEIISSNFDSPVLPEFQEARKGDINKSRACCDLSRYKLGLTNTLDLNIGIKELIH